MPMQYDAMVIGAGPGGNAAAEQVALRGGRACLIESHRLGGTCLNVGCMPTKAMLAAAEVYARAGQAERFGLDVRRAGVDGAAFMDRINETVTFLQDAISRKLAGLEGVDVVAGHARLVDPHTVEVQTPDGQRQINARAIIVASGSRPNRPGFLPWESSRIMTSADAVRRDSLPNSIFVLGGGALGCEFACLYAELGIETHLAEMAPRLLPRLESDISDAAHRFLGEKGIDIRTSVKVKAMTDTGRGLRVEFETAEPLTVSDALVAVGRSANTENIGLDVVGLDTDKGVVPVDDHCRTRVDSIYAVGDVAETRRHSHLAARMGRIAGDNIMGEDIADDRRIVPVGVYMHPEIACVGLCGEDEPRQCTDDTAAWTYDFEEGGMAMLTGREGGRLKVLADRNSGHICGASWIGPNAVDLIHEIALAMRNDLTLDDLDNTIHAHPGFAEAVRGIAEDWRNARLAERRSA